MSASWKIFLKMRLNALKWYDESNGGETSSKCNSLVTTILGKMKWKIFQQKTRYLMEGRCRKKARGAEDIRRQLKWKLWKPPYALISEERQRILKPIKENFCKNCCIKWKQDTTKNNVGDVHHQALYIKDSRFFSFENCTCNCWLV